MKRGADVESHRDAVQTRHDEVLEARALQLFGGTEDLRTDETGDVVDNHPGARLAANRAGETIGARFERHHVDALCRAVGDRRALAGRSEEHTSELQSRL